MELLTSFPGHAGIATAQKDDKNSTDTEKG
jgi:hypothetical protein